MKSPQGTGNKSGNVTVNEPQNQPERAHHLTRGVPDQGAPGLAALAARMGVLEGFLCPDFVDMQISLLLWDVVFSLAFEFSGFSGE